jgi:hypothetical protein
VGVRVGVGGDAGGRWEGWGGHHPSTGSPSGLGYQLLESGYQVDIKCMGLVIMYKDLDINYTCIVIRCIDLNIK